MGGQGGHEIDIPCDLAVTVDCGDIFPKFKGRGICATPYPAVSDEVVCKAEIQDVTGCPYDKVNCGTIPCPGGCKGGCKYPLNRANKLEIFVLKPVFQCFV